MDSVFCSTRSKWKTIVVASIVLFIFIAAYFPALQILAEKWWNSDEYGHAFLTLPLIFYMVWEKREVFYEKKKSLTWSGLVVVILATVFYKFALLTEVHTIILLTLYLAILGSLVYLAGVRALSKLAAPLFLFLLLLPLPQQLLIQITFPLQLFVSKVSELVIHLLSVPLFRQGNIMMLPERSFEVVEACSGLRSVVALMTLSVILGYFMLKRLSFKYILFVASIPVAVLVNVVRVVLMILLFYYWKVDLTIGAWHTFTGLMIFCLALFLLFSLQQILKWWEVKLK